MRVDKLKAVFSGCHVLLHGCHCVKGDLKLTDPGDAEHLGYDRYGEE